MKHDVLELGVHNVPTRKMIAEADNDNSTHTHTQNTVKLDNCIPVHFLVCAMPLVHHFFITTHEHTHTHTRVLSAARVSYHFLPIVRNNF